MVSLEKFPHIQSSLPYVPISPSFSLGIFIIWAQGMEPVLTQISWANFEDGLKWTTQPLAATVEWLREGHLT